MIEYLLEWLGIYIIAALGTILWLCVPLILLLVVGVFTELFKRP
jgi:hypothetical protein